MQKNISGYSNDVVDYLPSHAPVELKTSYIKLFLIDLKPHCNILKKKTLKTPTAFSGNKIRQTSKLVDRPVVSIRNSSKGV